MKRQWKQRSGLADRITLNAKRGTRNDRGRGWPEGLLRVPPMLVLIVGLVVSASSRVRQGQLPPPMPVDPTPLAELITAHEREALSNAASDRKKQVDILVDLASTHLEAAHSAIKESDYRKAERELDIYNKATAQAVTVALEQEKGRRGLAKKVEQHLYKHLRTLELIERLFPPERAMFPEAALKKAKQLRVRALNAAFDSGEVLDDPNKEKGKVSSPPDGARNDSGAVTGQANRFMGGVVQRAASTAAVDYLNEEEDDHVREAQNADDRIKVFMKIADRRLQALSGSVTPAPTDKKAQKKAEDEAREWGPLPQVGRAELLKHYAKAIEESVAKLEDAHERNPKSTAIAKALALLRDATERHLQVLKALDAQVKDDGEREALKLAIGQAEWANKGAREGLKEPK
ncbi:MAG TPA: hypothetical protein VGV87_22755 [Blastocatellia bacterium]|nr:hypothetical protein [Blastocatellia bacterium]